MTLHQVLSHDCYAMSLCENSPIHTVLVFGVDYVYVIIKGCQNHVNPRCVLIDPNERLANSVMSELRLQRGEL